MTSKELVDFCMPHIPCDTCPYTKECTAYYVQFKCFPFEYVRPREAYSYTEIKIPKFIIQPILFIRKEATSNVLHLISYDNECHIRLSARLISRR